MTLAVFIIFILKLLVNASNPCTIGFEVELANLKTIEEGSMNGSVFIDTANWTMFSDSGMKDEYTPEFSTKGGFNIEEIVAIAEEVEGVIGELTNRISQKANLLRGSESFFNIMNYANKTLMTLADINRTLNARVNEEPARLESLDDVLVRLCTFQDSKKEPLCFKNYKAYIQNRIPQVYKSIEGSITTHLTHEEVLHKITIHTEIEIIQLLLNKNRTDTQSRINDQLTELIRTLSEDMGPLDYAKQLTLETINDYIIYNNKFVSKIFMYNHINGDVFANRSMSTFIKHDPNEELSNQSLDITSADVRLRFQFTLMMPLSGFMNLLNYYASLSPMNLSEPKVYNAMFKEPDLLVNLSMFLLRGQISPDLKDINKELSALWVEKRLLLSGSFVDRYNIRMGDEDPVTEIEEGESLFMLVLSYGLMLFNLNDDLKERLAQTKNLHYGPKRLVPFMSRTPISELFEKLDSDARTAFIEAIQILCEVKLTLTGFKPKDGVKMSACSKFKLVNYLQISSIANLNDSEDGVVKDDMNFLEWVDSIIIEERMISDQCKKSLLTNKLVHKNVDRLSAPMGYRSSMTGGESDIDEKDSCLHYGMGMYTDIDKGSFFVELRPYVSLDIRADQLKTFVKHQASILLGNCKNNKIEDDDFVITIKEIDRADFIAGPVKLI